MTTELLTDARNKLLDVRSRVGTLDELAAGALDVVKEQYLKGGKDGPKHPRKGANAGKTKPQPQSGADTEPPRMEAAS